MASGNMKDIKRRIKSVQSTMQITKAMELVASSKLRRAKERVQQSRPYFNAMYDTITRISAQSRENSVYGRHPVVKNSLFIVIAGDRGLAGGFNSNVLKLALSQMEGKNAKVLTIGKKSQEFFAKRGFVSIGDYPGLAETLRIAETHEIVDQFLEMYRKQEVDEIFLCYTEFVSPLTQEAHCIQLLPSDFNKREAESGKKPAATEYDPSPEAVFESIIPEYLYGVLYGAVVESYASEQSARRMAMESASDNAGEMIEDLNLSYNRARQAAITQEITEIVAGSGQVGS
ncbi:MAG: ATP synthase F1 subunit gamma [Clostridiaceae bacterium]|nr:ATP synthase F1 subunit gamma [Clostridiaceae bacterium]